MWVMVSLFDDRSRNLEADSIHSRCSTMRAHDATDEFRQWTKMILDHSDQHVLTALVNCTW